MTDQDIRWQQRFHQFEKYFVCLQQFYSFFDVIHYEAIAEEKLRDHIDRVGASL